MSLCYLYALVRQNTLTLPLDPAPPLVGGANVPLRLTGAGAVAALWSPLEQSTVEPRRRDLLAHTKVLEAAMVQTLVLPVRFGIAVPADDLVKLLARHQAEIDAALERLTGKMEVGLKVEWHLPEVLVKLLDLDPELQRLKQLTARNGGYHERLRFGEMMAAKAQAARALLAQRILTELAPHITATEEKLISVSAENLVLDAAFLLDTARLPDFERALEVLDAALANDPTVGNPLAFKLVAPVPPFTFASLRLE